MAAVITHKEKNPMKPVVLFFLLFQSVIAWAEPVTLNLEDVDITILIKMVADVTHKNFVVDERVKGKVTVISKHPMQEDELYQVFLSILSVHHFAAISSGQVIKIVPDAEARMTSQGDAASDDIETRVIAVDHIDVAQLVPILRPLLPPQSHIAAFSQSNMLVISDRRGNIQRVLDLIARIDTTGQKGIDIMGLKHASASEVVRLLKQLAQQDPTNKTPGDVSLVADERTNSVLISGDKTARLRYQTLVSHLDTPLKSAGNTVVVYLRYAQAEELVPILQGISNSNLGKSGFIAVDDKTPKSDNNLATNIQADSNTNSLIITASPSVLRDLDNVIKKLDIRRAQVLVEAVIAEVEFNTAKEFGVQWVADGSGDGTGPVGLINFGSPGSGILDLANSVVNNVIPTAGGVNGATVGAGRFNHSRFNFAVLLRALSSDSGTNVLSTPSLVTLDNQEAKIVVGRNVPFITGQYSNTGAATGAANPFQTIQRQDVGLTLKVKPQINEGNTIKLDIEQEVSSLADNDLSASDIITNTRSIKTVVMVEDGNMVVLGGLLNEDLSDSTQKVPALGDIPVLGGLFRYQKAKKTKRNLMVFLHPVILRNSETENKISHDKYQYMQTQQKQQRDKGVPLTDAAEVPVLPDLTDFLTVLPGDDRPL
jgi:general secretion pathway protein D